MSHYDNQREVRLCASNNYDEISCYDTINKPKHYNSYPGVEVIELTQHMNFCRGNVIKYVARAEFKGAELEDLKKALWYLNKEIERVTNNE